MLLYCLYRTINGLLKNGRKQDAKIYPMLMVYLIEYQDEESSIRLSVIKQEKRVMGIITASNWSTVQQKEIKKIIFFATFKRNEFLCLNLCEKYFQIYAFYEGEKYA